MLPPTPPAAAVAATADVAIVAAAASIRGQDGPHKQGGGVGQGLCTYHDPRLRLQLWNQRAGLAPAPVLRPLMGVKQAHLPALVPTDHHQLVLAQVVAGEAGHRRGST